MKSTIIAAAICLIVFFAFPELFFGVVAGLLVGWNVLPQPEWVAELYAKAQAFIDEKF